jgi:hypothetical protein
MSWADMSNASNVVDVFNVSSNLWSTAALSVPRISPASVSLPHQGLAIFAGGWLGAGFCDLCLCLILY